MRANNLLLVTVLLALIQFSTIGSAESVIDCSKQADGVRLVDPSSCTNFIVCYKQRPVRRSCQRGLYFDDTTLNCNYAALVKCSRYPDSTLEPDTNEIAIDNNNQNVNCTCVPTCAPVTVTNNKPTCTPGTSCVTNKPPCTPDTSCVTNKPTPAPDTNCVTVCNNNGGGNNGGGNNGGGNNGGGNNGGGNNGGWNDGGWNDGRYHPYPPPPPQYPYWNLPWQIPCWTPCATPCPTTVAPTETTTIPSKDTNSSEPATLSYVLDQSNRRKYYVIKNGQAISMKCGLTQWFDEETKTCRSKSYFKKK